MGHPNPGLKTRAKYNSAPGPDPSRTRTPEASLGTETSRRAWPTAQHYDSAPLRPADRRRNLRLARGSPVGTLRCEDRLRLARGSLGRALYGVSVWGKSPPRSRPPSAGGSCGSITPLDGTHLLANHSAAGGGWRTVSGGVSWRWPSCHTADVTGVSSACTHHCAAIPGAGRDCGTLCGLA